MIDLRKPAKLADQRKEDRFQQDCAEWLKGELFSRGEPQLFYHCPNGEKREPRVAERLKLKGVLKGVSDVVLPMRSGEFSGVYCELKTTTGRPSKEQKDFLVGVAAEGYLAVVVDIFSEG